MAVLLSLVVAVGCAGKKRPFSEAVPGGDDTEDSVNSEGRLPGAMAATPGMGGVDEEAPGLAPLDQKDLPGDGIGGQEGMPCDADAGSCVSTNDPGNDDACVPTGPRDCTSNLDNDCDGQPDSVLDDVCVCAPESVEPCEEHPDLDGRGQCRAGTRTCILGESNRTSDWGACEGSVGPGEQDSCSVAGDDTDCDGTNNGGCPCIEGETRPCGPETENGICQGGSQTCVNGTFGPCVGAVFPAPRSCASNQDNDCDGRPDSTVDNVCTCTIGSVQACGTHPGRDGNGQCQPGSQRCEGRSNNATSTFGACTGSVGPGLQDTCAEGNDGNCNGIPNEGCACVNGQTRACGPDTEIGPCQRGTQTCTNGSFGQCQGAVFPAPRNCASAQDNDCDGRPDNTLDNVCTCQGSRTACGTTANTCFDLDTDPNNCGACGHSCRGQTCVDGTCTPATLATGQFVQGGLAVVGDDLYFAVAGSLRRVPKTGGNANVTTLVSAAQPGGTQLRGLTADGNQLYWAQNLANPVANSVLRMTTSGGATPITTAVAGGVVDIVQHSSGFTYWSERSATSDLTVYFRGPSSMTGGTSFGSSTASNLFAAVGDCIYTRVVTAGATPTASRTIRRICASGSSAEVFVGVGGAESTTGTVRNIVADLSGVYFAEEDRGIKRLALNTDSPSVTVIVPGGQNGGSMAIDGDNLYFVDGSDAFMNCTTNWTINRVSKNGGPVRTLVAAPIDCPGSLVVDATFVYWANTGNNAGLAGSLHRVPK